MTPAAKNFGQRINCSVGEISLFAEGFELYAIIILTYIDSFFIIYEMFLNSSAADVLYVDSILEYRTVQLVLANWLIRLAHARVRCILEQPAYSHGLCT